MLRESRYRFQCVKSASKPVASSICFWKPMLLCQVYGFRNVSSMVRGDWTGSGAVPFRNADAGTPLVGFEMKSERPSFAKVAVIRLLYTDGLKVMLETGEAK